MGSAARRPQRDSDLDSRAEIAEFVTRFYRDLAQDQRFHLYFNTLARVDWQAHNLELTDFWSGLLLGEEHREATAVIGDHRWLHDAVPFDAELFRRWLEIFDATLDEGWSGPNTDLAHRRGHGYAWAMAKRFVGVDLRQPDGAESVLDS